MRKEILNAMIPPAMVACETYLLKDGKQRKSICGKVASFGPDVITMGLLPTVAKFEDGRYSAPSEQAQTENRYLVNDALWFVLYKMAREDCETELAGILSETGSLLGDLNNIAANKSRLKMVKEYILHACVALKLALNTYEEA